jgi:hypothetical protein
LVTDTCKSYHNQLLDIWSKGYYSIGVVVYFHMANSASKMMVEWLTFMLHIWEVTDSNLGPKTDYPDWGFYSFPQSLKANAG